MKVQIFKGRGIHPWYVRLKGANGKVLTTSEGYYSKWNAKRAARRMYPNIVIEEI